MHPVIIIGTVRSLIVDVAMGQIPRSTERISSSLWSRIRTFDWYKWPWMTFKRVMISYAHYLHALSELLVCNHHRGKNVKGSSLSGTSITCRNKYKYIHIHYIHISCFQIIRWSSPTKIKSNEATARFYFLLYKSTVANNKDSYFIFCIK